MSRVNWNRQQWFRGGVVPATAFFLTLLAYGCESSSSSSGNAEVNLSFSGSYTGRNIVPNRSEPTNETTRAAITLLSIQITGTSVDIADNNGSSYDGTLGKSVFDKAALDTITSGETIAEAPLTFSGYDANSEKLVEFSGSLTAIATTDIEGHTVNATSGASRAYFIYSLDGANTRYALQGTWQEHAGRTLTASASAAGQAGEIIIHSSITTNDTRSATNGSGTVSGGTN